MSGESVSPEVNAPCFDYDTCPDCNGIGDDLNANFYCSTCNRTGSIPARRFCYQVVSPTMTTYFPALLLEPPEDYVSFVILIARTKREAVAAALKTDDFDEWRTYAKRDGLNPFAGVKAELARCQHGVCWNCNSDEDSTGCDVCDAQFQDQWEQLDAEIGS